LYALVLAKKINYKKGIGSAYSNLGMIYGSIGENKLSLENFKNNLKIAEEIGDEIEILSALGNIGIACNQEGDNKSALAYFSKALSISRKLKDRNREAIQLNNIGLIYADDLNYKQALESYYKALQIADSSDNKKLSTNILSAIGLLYREQGNDSAALRYFLKAKNKLEGSSDLNQKATTLLNLAMVCEEMARFQEALSYYSDVLDKMRQMGNRMGEAVTLSDLGNLFADEALKATDSIEKDSLLRKSLANQMDALKIDQELNRKQGIAMELLNIGLLDLELKLYSQSHHNLISSAKILDSLGLLSKLKDAYKGLSSLYARSPISLPDSVSKGLLSKEQMRLLALNYYREFSIIKDSIENSENKKQAVKKEMQYEFDKKETQQKAEQEKKDALAEADKRKQRIILWSVISGLFLVVAFAGFIYRSYLQKQKANIAISQQKKLIEEKQKEILDSIHYAKRIQRSLLPSERVIERNLKRSGKF
jgi:tetratricopeptide (TPR) repeat protein